MCLRNFVALGVVLVLPTLGWAQVESNDFDISRMLLDERWPFETFEVPKTRALQQALADGTVSEDMPVLITETASGKLALLADQMAFHHLAQGDEAGEPWMVSF